MDKDTDTISVKYYIPTTWNAIHEISENIFNSINNIDENVKEETRMTIVELVENAVKYGLAIPGKKGIEFDFKIGKNNIIIKISNRLINKKDGKTVKANIDKIKASGNPMELYIQRLRELLANPIEGVSQLGLYRIAYEGRFNLDYKIDNNILTIIASRTI
jgi:hypothetical protein